MIEVFEFNIPFKKPFLLANGAFKERRGFIIRYKNQVSEISPLPFFSEETIDSVRVWLFENLDECEDYLNNKKDEEWLENIKQESIRFGLSALKEGFQVDILQPIKV